MPRVIFVTDLPLWSMGRGAGGPAFTKTVSKYIEAGWDVLLISDEENNRDYPHLSTDHNIVIPPSFFKKGKALRRIGLVFRILDHWIATRRFSKAINRVLLEAEEPTLLYAYEVFGVKACSRIAKKKRIPFVTRFQGTNITMRKNTLLNRVRRYPHFQALSEPADLIIMTDDGTQGDQVLKRLHNVSPTIFLRNGLDLLALPVEKMKKDFDRIDFFQQHGLDIKPEECVFLTVSRLTGWKKVERALIGFAKYRERNNDGALIIVGDGDCRAKLEELAVSLGIQESVHFMGAVVHTEVYNFMMACDVFLSLYDLSNVGNPLLEAMTLGKCIITLDVGDTERIICCGENGVLMKTEELSRLGDIMNQLAHSKAMRELYGNAAADFARKNFWTWDDRMNFEMAEINKLMSKRA